MKKFVAAACLSLVLAAPVLSGGPQCTPESMAAAKAEMMKCAICKNLATHMDELAPVMTSEVVAMDNGMAITHGVTDASKVATFHGVCDAMHTSGAACSKMTETEMKGALCGACQGLMGLMQGGASMSAGKTKNGWLMVISSPDPETQKKISVVREEWSKMMGM